MITLKLQLILSCGSILCLIFVINLIRKYKLELKYTMLWLIMMAVIILLSIFPKSIEVFANVMGIELAVNALFFMAIFCILIIIFSLTATISLYSIKIKELSQEVGLMKYELEQLKNENSNKHLT